MKAESKKQKAENGAGSEIRRPFVAQKLALVGWNYASRSAGRSAREWDLNGESGKSEIGSCAFVKASDFASAAKDKLTARQKSVFLLFAFCFLLFNSTVFAQQPTTDAQNLPRLAVATQTNAPAASEQLKQAEAADVARLVSLLNTNNLSTNAHVRQMNNYVIVPNDVIWLKVYQEDDLETKAKVNKDGLVTIPLLGTMAISGKSVDQAAEMIRKELDRRFIVNPQVGLTVMEYSKRKYTILGQISRPGVYEYPGDEKLTVLNAIALAGGFTRLAAQSRVKIQRIEQGEFKEYKVDPDAISKRPGGRPFEIRPDDTITIGSRIF